MFQRRTTGSVVCPSCGSLVGVRDDSCYTCGRANPGLWGFGPLLRQLGQDLGFVPMVIGTSSILYLVSLLLSGSAIRMDGLMSMLAPSTPVLFLLGASGAVPVFAFGRWWTVLSAGWLHAGLLHILFNMYYVRMFGPATAEVIGPARTVIIYTVAGVTGFLLSSFAGAYLGWIPLPMLRGAGFTVGASAPIFGLLGALLHYSHNTSSFMKQQVMSFVLPFFLFGLIMPGVDNYAHAGGFAGGYLTSAFLNPMTRERGDHMLIAAGCLVATALSIAASILTGLSLFR
ncbi:MAG: rhomboid family intramembrane serine protease [Acidobacteria bacterium]|nr:rhomboid family intramembrane serine protease [Acidobacteriota bacterium]